jgi:hypothetical protein
LLAPDAVIKDVFGTKRPLREVELDAQLAKIETSPDGTIRGLASHWLAGKPLGGHAAEGTRPDDPNDRIPHELRRDLRGLYALFSWLDHNDIHEGNVLDMFVADPGNPDRHYVKHYWIDYGIGLGFGAAKNSDYRFGYEWYLDFAGIARSLVTFGAVDQPWDDRRSPGLRGIGLYETDLYDPGSWKSSSPWYLPIYDADRYDKFWASKIVIRFTREQIRAAVDSARLTDPRAAAWLTDALIERQRATAKYWFERVNPIDELAVAGDTLCFEDLAIAHAFARAASTHYSLSFYDRTGTALGTTRANAGDSGTTCAIVKQAPAGYTIVRIDTARPRFSGTTYVHLAREPATQATRVIGIWRP